MTISDKVTSPAVGVPFRTFTGDEWVYPDMTVTSPSGPLTLEAARGGNVVFQVLTDKTLEAACPYTLTVEGAVGITVTPYQLLPVGVSKNSAPRGKMNTAKDYEEVKHFVTRRAPFTVYDRTAPLEDGKLLPGRAAFCFRLTVSPFAAPGERAVTLTLRAGEFLLCVPFAVTVHKAEIPAATASPFIVANWIYPERLANDHKVKMYSEEFWKIYRNYLAHLLDIRSTHLSLKESGTYIGGTPVRDEHGVIVDFDFTDYEKALRIGREMGFPYIYGPYVARFHRWDEPELYLLWDNDVSTGSPEGYRQLQLYFTRIHKMIEKNGWQNCYFQCLVDEPQFMNSPAYRALSCIFRRFVPGIRVHDPVETTEIAGALDIWCVKQSVYEKYLPAFQAYQALGEHMTFYTCGYPAGDTMNRVIDLPLSAGRLAFWMCLPYNFEGFLHWGYHVCSDIEDENYPKTAAAMPAGNQNIVYPYGDSVCESIRSHAQRAGAEDWELLNIVKKKNHALAEALVARACRSFNDYETDPAKLAAIRHDLLAAADESM